MRRALCVLCVTCLCSGALAQSVSTDQSAYDVGERVVVSFSGCPGSGTDWVGIYPASQQQHQGSTYWRYCQGGQAPAGAGPASGSLTFLPMSLPPGEWQARLFFNDGYTLRAATTFRIESPGAAPTPPPSAHLRVMCFNIWVSASNVPDGISHVASAILETNPDLIGLQECSSGAFQQVLTLLRADPRFADATGVSNSSQGVISRTPLEAPYTAPGVRAVGCRIRTPSGEAIRFFSCHLSAAAYGPYTIRDSLNIAQALADERATRLADLTGVMFDLTERQANDPALTTILVGDFNTPSHLDWTDANRSQNYGQAVQWPVTLRLTAAGYSDAFRAAHPDPVTVRGLTWTPGAPRDSLDRTDVHDRIDMIHVRARKSLFFSCAQAFTLDRPPWPSDHRAVVADLAFVASCHADVNADGVLNSQDFFDFLAAFFAGC